MNAMWTVLIGATLALSISAQEAPVPSPSASESGTVTYSVSHTGQRMLYANPFDDGCKEAAVSTSTWVIEMEQPETIYSFQMTAVPNTVVNGEEQVVVRVGGQDPVTQGVDANSLCAVATVNETSSMLIFDCQEPVSGTYITISRNDAGPMNICAFSASLGMQTLAPADPTSTPFVSVPEEELMVPKTPDQESTTSEPLPILLRGSTLQNFATQSGMYAPAPSPALAPDVAPSATLSTLPLLQFATEESDMETLVPAPAPAPVPAPEVDIIEIPILQLISDSDIAPTPAPVPAPSPLEDDIIEIPILQLISDSDVAPAPAPVPAPSPLEAAIIEIPLINLLTADSDSVTPTPAPAPAPESTDIPLLLLVDSETPAPAPAPESDEIPLLLLIDSETPAPSPAEAPAPADIPLLALVDPTPAAPTTPAKVFAVQDTTTTPPASPSLSSSQTGASQSTNSGKNLSGGAIAGIVIGSLVGIALLAAVALFIARHRDYRVPSGTGGRSLSSAEV